jgi:hypothetical protein
MINIPIGFDSDTTLAEKVLDNKPAYARDRCLSIETLASSEGPIIPFTGNLVYPDSLPIPLPALPAEAGVVLDQVSKQVCGLDISILDNISTEIPSALDFLTGPIAELQNTLIQTRFGTPRTVAGDSIETWTNKCQLRPVDASDYSSNPLTLIMPSFIDDVKAIFPEGVCDYSLPGVGVQPTQTWLQYGSAEEVTIGGEQLPEVPEGSRNGWASPAFGLSH